MPHSAAWFVAVEKRGTTSAARWYSYRPRMVPAVSGCRAVLMGLANGSASVSCGYDAALLLLVLLLPGAFAAWGFERHVQRYGRRLKDWLLRLAGLSAGCLAVGAWPLHWLASSYWDDFTDGTALPWPVFLAPVAYLAVPAAVGWLLGLLMRPDNSIKRDPRKPLRVRIASVPVDRFGGRPSWVGRPEKGLLICAMVTRHIDAFANGGTFCAFDRAVAGQRWHEGLVRSKLMGLGLARPTLEPGRST